MKLKATYHIYVNGRSAGIVTNTEDVIAVCLEFWVPHLEYMSLEAIRENALRAFSLINEAEPLRGAAKTSRLSAFAYLQWLAAQAAKAETDKDLDYIRTAHINYFLETFLRAEKLGTLAGFGYAKYDTVEGRRRLVGGAAVNPERKSITHARIYS
jgi:hypothetical protein